MCCCCPIFSRHSFKWATSDSTHFMTVIGRHHEQTTTHKWWYSFAHDFPLTCVTSMSSVSKCGPSFCISVGAEYSKLLLTLSVRQDLFHGHRKEGCLQSRAHVQLVKALVFSVSIIKEVTHWFSARVRLGHCLSIPSRSNTKYFNTRPFLSKPPGQFSITPLDLQIFALLFDLRIWKHQLRDWLLKNFHPWVDGTDHWCDQYIIATDEFGFFSLNKDLQILRLLAIKKQVIKKMVFHFFTCWPC